MEPLKCNHTMVIMIDDHFDVDAYEAAAFLA